MTEYRRHTCPLHEAIRLGDVHAIRQAHDKDAFAIYRADGWGRYALESAFRGGRPEVMRAMIDCGATAMQGQFIPLHEDVLKTEKGRECLVLLFLAQIINTDEDGVPRPFLEMDENDDGSDDSADMVECRQAIITARSGLPSFTLCFSLFHDMGGKQGDVDRINGMVFDALREAKARVSAGSLEATVDMPKEDDQAPTQKPRRL